MRARWSLFLVLSACGGPESAPIVGFSDAGRAPSPTDACAIWATARADLSEGRSSANPLTCSPGEVDAVGRANTLALVNGYRAIAGLPAVSAAAAYSAKAQACALMMDANGSLSHTPPASWRCYSDDGADGARSSNLATTPGVQAIDLYMVDSGNHTTLGHRRWILSPSLGAVGVGSTPSASCLWVFDRSGAAAPRFVAWPPDGDVPAAVFAPLFGEAVDDTGWSVQSDQVPLAGAQVTVSLGTEPLPVRTRGLEAGFGSTSAIAFVPDGWRTVAGNRYDVEVAAGPTTLRYGVNVIGCP